jgi:hypothetical protein
VGGLAAVGGCTDPKIAQETAEVSGFTDVQVTGYEAWGCGKDDAYHTGFTARGVNGSCIHGVVCSNVFKGATLRILGPSNACPVRQQ